jgi:poly(ribitol-phosphate) beta-N-acetylglucosaminyltransferase
MGDGRVDEARSDLVKVSVVVPVYNAGEYLQPCVDSLLAQSLPAEELELIFVDDGSSDDSLIQLRALEAEWSHLRAIATPHSGWPGKPRNVGIDEARGEYVMFVDQDDIVEPEALMRMYEFGAANDADIVVGKVISDFRGVHHYLYRENRARCTVHDSRLMGSQTPHKMLRTAFLREREIRFAEGRRRLEDQLFMTKAYLTAASASIVADYICYRYLQRADLGNAGSYRIAPTAYYDNLREVLDVVDDHTEPGEFRDHCYRRFLKTEMLGRLGGRKLFNAPPEHRIELLREIRRLLEERFGTEVLAGLPAALRARAALVSAGTLPDLVAFAERMRDLKVHTRLTRIEPAEAGLALTVEAEFHYAGGPLRLESKGTDWLLPRALVGSQVEDAERTVEPLSDMLGDVVIRHREHLDEWFLPGRLQPAVEPDGDDDQCGGRLRWRGTVVLVADVVAGGAALRRGTHDLLVRLDAFGLNRTVRLAASSEAGAPVGSLLLLGETRATAYVNRGGYLSLKTPVPRPTALETVRDGARVEVVSQQLNVDLPVAWSDAPKSLRVRLNSDEEGKARTIEVRRDERGGSRWSSSTSALTGLGGRYHAELRIEALGRLVLPMPDLVPPPAPGVKTLVGRGLRAAGRRLPQPVGTRLRDMSRWLARRPPDPRA